MNSFLEQQERELCLLYGCSDIEEVLQKQNKILNRTRGIIKNGTTRD